MGFAQTVRWVWVLHFGIDIGFFMILMGEFVRNTQSIMDNNFWIQAFHIFYKK